MTRQTTTQAISSPFAELTPHRLEAFFDAVFAIIMTILVLGLALPGEPESLSPVDICIEMLPQIIHFALAFFILAAFWGAHQRTFTLIKKLDPALIRLTFILLFVACLLPFTSTLAGDNHTEGPAVLLFHMNMLLLSLIFLYQWVYVNSSGLSNPIPHSLYKFILMKSLIVPFASIFAIIITFIDPPWSSVCYFFIPVFELSLLHLKDRLILPDNEEIMVSQNTEFITIPLPQDVCTSIEEVAHVMEIPKEELILHILSGWKKQHRVNIGSQGRLCQLHDEHYSDFSTPSSTDINRKKDNV